MLKLEWMNFFVQLHEDGVPFFLKAQFTIKKRVIA